MFIEQLRIYGYKSLNDVLLDDLGPINVFHGYNDVGKSNILEAIDLFLQLLPFALEAESEWEALTPYDLRPYALDAIFRLQNAGQPIQWEARLQLPESSLIEIRVCLDRTDRRRGRKNHVELPGREKRAEAEEIDLTLEWTAGPPDKTARQRLCEARAGFNLLTARRRFQTEYLAEERAEAARRTRRPVITADNLKRALFDAYASPDMDERARFETLQMLLARHFQVGQLDVALDRPTDDAPITDRRVLVRFLRPGVSPHGAVGIENVGSGVRQIVLILGQILFNPARAVGIEEPEMNLSPEWQDRLMAVLRDLVSPPAGELDQIFLTSHSPQFEAAEHFYDVTYTGDETSVQKLPLPQRDRYFVRLDQGEQIGPYLNSLNQITLPQRVIDDLGLSRREPVFFYKTLDGCWQLRTKAELLALMEAGEEYDVAPDTADVDCSGQ
jgi:hypothetical protein